MKLFRIHKNQICSSNMKFHFNSQMLFLFLVKTGKLALLETATEDSCAGNFGTVILALKKIGSVTTINSQLWR